MKKIYRALLVAPMVLLGLLSFAHGASTSYYGPGLSMDGLANLRIGPDGQIGIRFRALHTGSVDKILQQYQNVSSGYMDGTGGQIRMQLQTDDGTANHYPSGTVLATVTDTHPTQTASGSVIQTFTLSSPLSITAGTLYHIVYVNVDGSPGSNYVSFDGMYTSKDSSPVQPTVSDTDLATVWGSPGAWKVNLHITPSFNVHFSDGYVQGTGYIDSSSGTSNPATETFTVSGGDKKAVSVSAKGSGLTFTLRNSGGAVLASGSGSAASYPGWMTYTFPQTITLTSGQTYNLTISGTQGRLLQKGNLLGLASRFPDGYYTGNSGYDLQFYFTLSSDVSSTRPAAPTGLRIVQ